LLAFLCLNLSLNHISNHLAIVIHLVRRVMLLLILPDTHPVHLDVHVSLEVIQGPQLDQLLVTPPLGSE
jgi:hypothetical protein